MLRGPGMIFDLQDIYIFTSLNFYTIEFFPRISFPPHIVFVFSLAVK